MNAEALDTPTTLAQYLDQGEVWMSKRGPFPIADMDPVYRRRAIHWLTRNCSELYRRYTLELELEADHTPDLETVIQWVDARPANWIKTTTLYQAIVAGTLAELVP